MEREGGQRFLSREHSADLLSALLDPSVRGSDPGGRVLTLAALVASFNIFSRGMCNIFFLVQPEPSWLKVLWAISQKALFVVQYLLQVGEAPGPCPPR